MYYTTFHSVGQVHLGATLYWNIRDMQRESVRKPLGRWEVGGKWELCGGNMSGRVCSLHILMRVSSFPSPQSQCTPCPVSAQAVVDPVPLLFNW